MCAAADDDSEEDAESVEGAGAGTGTGLLKSGSSMCSSILHGHITSYYIKLHRIASYNIV